MKFIGEVYRLKCDLEELMGELTPSFDEVIEGWLGNPSKTRFKDPNYVYSVTCFTKPLELFLSRIVSQFKTPNIVGGPLERGFGFGKTHAFILLWHLFNSGPSINLKKYIDEELVRETLVLGIDFSSAKPFARIIEELETYANPMHSISRIKDPRLIQAVSEVLGEIPKRELLEPSSNELVGIIYDILKKFEERGGNPKLLLLIDELGWGLANKIRRYVNERRDEQYREIDAMLNFLSDLYETFFGKGISSIIIWVLAEQDLKEINAIALKYQDDTILCNKIRGLLDHLDVIAERYRRKTGGLSIAELTFSPEHAIEIAKFRILEAVNNSLPNEAKNQLIKKLEEISKQLNLIDVFEDIKSYIDRYYPFSPGLVNLLKKLMNNKDIPRTEFVRTVIYVAAKAAEKALKEDPLGSYVIGIKHLNIPEVVCINLMSEFETDWFNVVSDIEHALRNMEDRYRIVAEIIAKYILAKGVTINIPLLLETHDERILKKYGTRLEEIQLEILSSFKESEALSHIENITEALDELKAESARIDVREAKGRSYHLPTLLRTIYNMLSRFTVEERGKLDNKSQIPLYIAQSTISSLFNLRIPRDVVIILKEYRTISDMDALLSSISEPQNSGDLAIIIVPPWDLNLFNNLYIEKQSYDSILDSVTRRLQNIVSNGQLKRPLHVVIIMPALTEVKLNNLLNDLAIYEGTRRFLDYLRNREKIIEERIREYEDTFIKRKEITDYFIMEIKRRRRLELKSVLERQINEARRSAQKQLITFSRKLALKVLELYSKVIYYSLDTQSFVYRDLESLILEASRDADKISEELQSYKDIVASLDRYAAIMNKFLDLVIDALGYIKDPIRIAEILKENYREEFSSGVLRKEDRMDDVIESIMMGVYGVKPLSLDIADKALDYLNQHIIDFVDKTVKINLDRKKRMLIFEITEKKRKEEVITETPSVEAFPTLTPLPEALINRIVIPLDPKINVSDFIFRIFSLANKVEISLIELSLRGGRFTANISLENLKADDRPVLESIMNFIARLTNKYGGKIIIQVKMAEKVSEGKIKEIFGDYYKPGQSGVDKFLLL